MKNISFISIVVLIFISVMATHAQGTVYNKILPMKDRAAFIDQITQKRVNTLLPVLMNKHDIDMWIVISREYNEDPIIKTMLPATWLSARRTTILVMHRVNETQVDAFAIAPYKIGNVFERAWDKKQQPDQWQALVDLIAAKKPKNIAINESALWGHADGLVVTDKKRLMAALPKAYQSKIISAEPLAVSWLEQRIPEEITLYHDIVSIAHGIIAEGFSNKVITVNKTTTEDLVWWFREKVRALKLQAWFHPTVAIQRKDNKKFDHEDSFTNGYGDNVILAGDLLHVDFGITYLRLNTDTQQHAYVLKGDEVHAPDYLINAFADGNKLQDIFTGQFAQGRTGNDVLLASRQSAIAQGLKPSIYTHPLGYHGHAAGTTLGMWDSQGGVAGTGDYPLHINTVYSIELNNASYIKAWDKEIRIMLEENALFDQSGVTYLDGRQTKLHIIQNK